MVSLKRPRNAGSPIQCAVWITGIFVLAALAGCSTPKSFLSKSVADPATAQLPHRILLVPPDVSVLEVTIGGVSEKDSDWSKQAQDNIRSALKAQAAARNVELLDMPELTQEEQDVVDRHVAMFELVAGSASQYALSTDSTWKKLAPGLHYTVGPGLSFLSEKTGAEAAMIISAEDAVSTPGRLAVLLATILMFGIPALPPGYSFLAAGIVDLSSGDLLWHDFDWNVARRDLRKGPDANGLVSDVFETFPGKAKALTLKP
jgi:hypothetical protein